MGGGGRSAWVSSRSSLLFPSTFFSSSFCFFRRRQFSIWHEELRRWKCWAVVVAVLLHRAHPADEEMKGIDLIRSVGLSTLRPASLSKPFHTPSIPTSLSAVRVRERNLQRQWAEASERASQRTGKQKKKETWLCALVICSAVTMHTLGGNFGHLLWTLIETSLYLYVGEGPRNWFQILCLSELLT